MKSPVILNKKSRACYFNLGHGIKTNRSDLFKKPSKFQIELI